MRCWLPQLAASIAGVLRVQVLMALQTLVNALGQQSVQCNSLLLPVLQHCTDASQVPHCPCCAAGL